MKLVKVVVELPPYMQDQPSTYCNLHGDSRDASWIPLLGLSGIKYKGSGGPESIPESALGVKSCVDRLPIHANNVCNF